MGKRPTGKRPSEEKTQRGKDRRGKDLAGKETRGKDRRGKDRRGKDRSRLKSSRGFRQFFITLNLSLISNTHVAYIRGCAIWPPSAERF